LQNRNLKNTTKSDTMNKKATINKTEYDPLIQKNKKERKIIRDLKNSWIDFKENKQNILIAFFADFAFITILFSIINYYLPTLYENVEKLINVMQTVTIEENITPEVMNQLLIANQAAQAYYHNILQTFGILVVYGLISYTLFQGIAWYVSHLSERECSWNWKNLGKFLARFGLLSIGQFIVALVLIMWYSQTQTVNIGDIAVLSKENTGSLAIILCALFALVIDYMSVLSYGFMISKNWVKNIFTQPFHNMFYLFSAYLIFAVLIFLGVHLFFISAEWNPFISLAFGVLILLPLFTYLRIFIYKVTSNVLK